MLEHIDGPRLSSLIRRYGPLQEQQYLPLAIDVAAALHYFRTIGWTHLDIKPSYVIMGAPARLIRKRFDEATVSALLDIRWWDWDPHRVSEHLSAIRSGDVDYLKAAADK